MLNGARSQMGARICVSAGITISRLPKSAAGVRDQPVPALIAAAVETLCCAETLRTV